MRKLQSDYYEYLNNQFVVDKAYKDYLKELAQNRKNVVFFNSSAEHASAVMSTIFQNSENLVKVFAGGLTGEVSSSPEYRKSLDNFLRRGGRLQILLEEYNADCPPINIDLLRFYKLKSTNQVVVKTHPENYFIKRKDADEGGKIHFCVADSRMYRIETDTLNYLAEGNFNDEKTAKALDVLFDSVFNGTTAKEENIFQ
jgi:hypothetical protein